MELLARHVTRKRKEETLIKPTLKLKEGFITHNQKLILFSKTITIELLT